MPISEWAGRQKYQKMVPQRPTWSLCMWKLECFPGRKEAGFFYFGCLILVAAWRILSCSMSRSFSCNMQALQLHGLRSHLIWALCTEGAEVQPPGPPGKSIGTDFLTSGLWADCHLCDNGLLLMWGLTPPEVAGDGHFFLIRRNNNVSDNTTFSDNSVYLVHAQFPNLQTFRGTAWFFRKSLNTPFGGLASSLIKWV